MSDRVKAKVGNDRLTAINEDVLASQVLVDHLLIVQVAHALGDLRGDVDLPVEIGLLIGLGVKVFVQADAPTQRHDYGAFGRLNTGAYE